MDYDVENIEMEGSCMYMNTAMGWDSEGRLYGWGKNNENCLGLPDDQEYHKPTLVDKFNEKYKATYVQTGREFAMVKAIEKETGDKIIVSVSRRSTPSLYGVLNTDYD